MNEIKVLDKHTIDKIAAGEVVERPSSIVKELTENAIDAGATAVSVEIKNGGIDLIRVTDNGCGIEKEQLRNAFLRHSTSKIRDAADLAAIQTLGFRGEALSSIAAVAKVELCTKTKDALTGSIFRIEGGEEKSFSDAGLPDGTTVLVRDLFYNTPARRKFLKSAQTETSYVTTIIEKIALSHPELSVKYTVNGTQKLFTSGNGSKKDTIYAIFGRDITSSLLEVHTQNELLSLDGFIGKPEVARSTRALENYYINGRYVKDKIVSSAIEEAYKGQLMKGAFPFTDLQITLEPELLDVNVHPSKMEIRFFDNEQIFSAVSELLKTVLTQREEIRSFTPDEEETQTAKADGTDYRKPKPEPSPEPFESVRKQTLSETEHPQITVSVAEENTLAKTQAAMGPASYDEEDSFDTNSTVAEDTAYTYEQQTLFDTPFISEEARTSHRIVGQIFDTYWIVEYGQEMYLIDQHAAHEKVMYESFMAQQKQDVHPSQQLAPAQIVTLTPKEEQVLEKVLPELERIGFHISHFGGAEYAIHAVPTDLYALNEKDLFLSFLDDIHVLHAQAGSELLADRIATAACKAAVKGNHKLSVTEMHALIDQLLSLDDPYHCPHGRPTIIKMSKTELEKKFRRIV